MLGTSHLLPGGGRLFSEGVGWGVGTFFVKELEGVGGVNITESWSSGGWYSIYLKKKYYEMRVEFLSGFFYFLFVFFFVLFFYFFIFFFFFFF